MTDIRFWIGIRIIELRKKRNMSQEELANISGLSRKTMHNIECGKTYTSTITLDKIMNALDVTIHEFYEDDKYEHEKEKHN